MKKGRNVSNTILTIVLGFTILYLLTEWKSFIFLSCIIGLIGILSPYLSEKIDWFWWKLSWLLSLIVPNILLSIVFYLFLFPIAILARILSKRDPLKLRNNENSTYVCRNDEIKKETFERPW